jgi:pseudaminic acid cytidylyltransferase
MNNLAIIPARGGSKRIPRKNIKNFLGKPIITYSIEAAIRSQLFSEVMVSTDDDEIAKIAKNAGASVPFFRSVNNSDDTAILIDVILEVVSEYRNQGRTFNSICCVMPTSPFITNKFLKESYDLLLENEFSSVIPIVEYGYPIQRAFILNNNKLSMKWPDNYIARSQDLQKSYHDSGMFFWLTLEGLKKYNSGVNNNTGGYIVPESEVHDIDNEEDWILSEIKYQFVQKNGC